MTQFGLESSRPLQEAADSSAPATVSSPSSQREVSLPRFSLKKRPISGSNGRANLTSVNSAFLTGIFADVAKVQETTVQVSDSDPRLDHSLSFKKSRVSLNKSLSRCGKSFKILSEAATLCSSTSLEANQTSSTVPHITPTGVMGRLDSLHYQLSCVSDSSNSELASTGNAVQLAFPKLPSFVSANSSSATLPRKVSDLQMYMPEAHSTANEESYGWFVEMDNEAPSTKTTDPYAAKPNTTGNLAFSAPTAPKAVNYDAEVEWAKAADTVDDVLGDFF